MVILNEIVLMVQHNFNIILHLHLNQYEQIILYLPTHFENVRDRLAENIHELWSMNKIASGWRFGEVNV